jgi:uncharacterized protein (TIGR00369 family)
LDSALGGGRFLGFEANEKKARMTFNARQAFCNSGGVIQGGFVTGWMDSAMARAVLCATEGALAPSSLEIKVNFLKATLPGAVIAEGWIQRLGRSIAFLEARLTNESGEVLATASSTAKLVPTKQEVPYARS